MFSLFGGAPDLPDSLSGGMNKTKTLRNTQNGNCCYLIGVSHLSDESVAQVHAITTYTRPQTLLLELCPDRLNVLHANGGRPNILPHFNEMVTGRFQEMLSPQFWLLTLPHMRLECLIGTTEGGEMLAAMRASEELAEAGSAAYPALFAMDLPTSIIFPKLLATMWFDIGPIALAKEMYRSADLRTAPLLVDMEERFAEMNAAVADVIASEAPPSDKTRAELRDLASYCAKLGENWEDFFAQCRESEVMRKVLQCLVEDRDTVLAGNIRLAMREGSNRRCVAVVGAAHVDGVVAKFKTVTKKDLDAAMQFPADRVNRMLLHVGALSLVFPSAAVLASLYFRRRGGKAQVYFKRARALWFTSSTLCTCYYGYRMYSSYETTRKLQRKMYNLD